MNTHWYLVHTKIRQERVALENLQRQGFHCFLPQVRVEQVRRGSLKVVEEPLFPRYLFIELGTDQQAQSWMPIRSTLGVSRLVCFGQTPAKLPAALVDDIRGRTEGADTVLRQFNPGQAVVVTEGPFAGIEAIFDQADGEARVMVLLNLMSKQVRLAVAPNQLRKAG